MCGTRVERQEYSNKGTNVETLETPVQKWTSTVDCVSPTEYLHTTYLTPTNYVPTCLLTE